MARRGGSASRSAGFEILDHTADVGVRSTGATLEEAFELAARGVAEIAGIWHPGPGRPVEIDLTADDLGALLVDFLSEILWIHDSSDVLIAAVEVAEVTTTAMHGILTVVPRGERDVAGTQVKAITYHQLSVERSEEGWVATVYVDV